MAYIETPRTDAGNATYMSNAFNLENISIMENSFLSPSKNKDDLISQLRKGRGINLKTPRSRVPFTDRLNLPTATQGEFTPLLRSAVRNDSIRRENRGGAPKTPAFLKHGYKDANSPALPTVEVSGLYDDDTASSSVGDSGTTPALQISSSAQSTPLAVLPKRDAGGVLADQGNVMTLREQENIINKIEKENFGLKLKIHFLEDGLHKSGPEFNKAALKENTDLKVDRVTLQKELARARKTMTQAERELEVYRAHLQDAQEKLRRKHVDESLREELKSLKKEITSKSAEADELRQKLESVEDKDEAIEKVKGDVEDLESDIRERDRAIDVRDDEIDRLQAQSKKDSEEMANLYEELDAARNHIEDFKRNQKGTSEQALKIKESHEEIHKTRQELQNLEIDLRNAKQEAEDAKEDARDALEAKQKAEDDLEELHDEMSNKSFNTKGLSRQLEEKANKLQNDLASLYEANHLLEERFEEKSAELQKVEENASRAIGDAEIRAQKQKNENDALRRESEGSVRKCENLASQLQQMSKELRSKSEEKDLLHSRHDALTIESQALQKELSKAQASIQSFQQNLEDEKQHSLDNDQHIRNEAADEINRLSDDIEKLHRELEDKESQHAADKDHWESQRRTLFSQKEKLEEQAAGLQRTVNKLEEAEGTLSGREIKLKEALESEKQRFQNEEAILNRQIQDLNSDIIDKRHKLDDLRSELSDTKEEVRVAQRHQADLEEKVEALEDDVEVLQGGFDEEVERANVQIKAITQEADSLRQKLEQAKEEIKQLKITHNGIQVGQQSEQQLMSQFQATEVRLEQIKSEKQALQDKLATNNIELHSLRTSSAEVKAERDEMKSQLKQMQTQVDQTFRLDQEKIDLRKSKLKLENDVGRLRGELKGLVEKQEVLERELEDEIERAGFEAGNLRDEVADLQRKLSGRDRDLSASKQKIQRLEFQVTEIERRSNEGEKNLDDTAELSLLLQDLATARKKETEYLQRESTHKENIKELKQNVARLERQIHESEISRLAVSSPQSSVGGSAHKNEVGEIRRQLTETHQRMKDLRTKSRVNEKELQRNIVEIKNQAQSDLNLHEQERDRLEQELSRCHLQMDEQTVKLNSTENIVARLRTRIQLLEKDIQAPRMTTTSDFTVANERKDLHEMLKDTKLTAESLQVKITSCETLLSASSAREKELRAQLSRIREERSLQLNKSTALSSELENLQTRYEHAIDKLAREQKSWEEERKNIMSTMRFPSMIMSNLHVCDTAEERRRMEQFVQEIEKKHLSELKSLSVQIQWLRARCTRERTFREGLAHEKWYLLELIEGHNACNKINLATLARLGIQRTPNPPPLPPNPTRAQIAKHALDSLPDPAGQKPRLRQVALMVIAGLRMQRMAKSWAAEKNVKAGLVQGLEGGRRSRRGASGVGTPAASGKVVLGKGDGESEVLSFMG